MGADPAEAVGIEATARLLGAYAWVEGRLFEVLGELAARGGDVPEVCALLDAQSQQHAWHASLFAQLVPSLPGLERRAPDPAPAPGPVPAPVPAVGELLGALSGAAPGADALALLARVVLPRLVTGYRRHLRRTRAASDGAVARALRLVVRDELDALLDAEELLEALLGEGRPVDAALVGSLEGRLAPGGPGLVPWPADPQRP